MKIEKNITPKGTKIPRRLKNVVIEACKKHAWNIGVSHYKGDILYMAEDEKREDDSATIASAEVDRRYLRVTFKIYPAAIEGWKKAGDRYIDDVMAHEVAHVATQHMMDVAGARYCDSGEMKDAWETLTTVIGDLSIKLAQYRDRK